MKRILLVLNIFVSYYISAQNLQYVEAASGDWSSLIKLARFDPNDDQQSVADTDFVGNATHSIMETQKKTITFSDGITDEVYYFRVRMGQSNPNTSFYFGVDVSGDLIADLFIEANVKAKPNYVSFHKRDYAKTGLSPSQTSWLNGSQNQELILTSRNAVISDYSAGTDIDGGTSGTDYWIEFAFTEEIIKSYVSDVFGIAINGDSVIALYGFTSTSQTSNGDVMGVDDKIPGELDKTWQELGVIINGTLNNIASGEIVSPIVNSLVTENTSPTITGLWGGEMLGDDTLSVIVDNVTYTVSNGLVINGLSWSLNITNKELSYGSFEVSATTYRASSGLTATDTTRLELTIIPSTEPTDTSVSSGNDGGLESNGDLATLIAQRNFKRKQNGNVINKKSLQLVYSKNELVQKSTATRSLQDYLPETGVNNTEVAYVSSPEDLLQITNAAQIFAVDYYQGSNRVAAALVTETNGKIYDHSKIICDRLNSSSLEDAWVFSLQGYQIISTKLKRSTGNTEYTLSFSVKLGDKANELHSFWNIGEYPEGDYYNFQIWGSSFSQLFSICNYVLNELNSDKALIGENLNNRIPSVFVSSGYYSNGEIRLKIINKSSAKSIEFNGNYKQTEVSERYNMIENISLSGAFNEEVVVSTGSLFDIGFSITSPDSNQQDALYLADGPWGVDYPEGYASIDFFKVENQAIEYSEKLYEVERQPSVSGMVKGNVNLFRHLLPGDQTLDVTKFNSVEFNISNSQPIEIILMPENLTDWNNRLRYTMPANSEETFYTISFDDFKDANGVKGTLTDIKTIVFSVIGDYVNYVPFSIDLNGLAFGITQSTLGVNESLKETAKLINYPNPFKNTTTIKLTSQTLYIDIQVIDLLGRTVDLQHIIPANQKVIYNAPNLSKGLYKYILKDSNNARFVGTFLIE